MKPSDASMKRAREWIEWFLAEAQEGLPDEARYASLAAYLDAVRDEALEDAATECRTCGAVCSRAPKSEDRNTAAGVEACIECMDRIRALKECMDRIRALKEQP